ncbi:hypothetical protein [Brassicibacter mesophilus]|uniref:hypothetical protein n=1 Tax=Brassicibacter mesophilus TaxID=745119 RepID=UPI003D1A6C90
MDKITYEYKTILNIEKMIHLTYLIISLTLLLTIKPGAHTLLFYLNLLYFGYLFIIEKFFSLSILYKSSYNRFIGEAESRKKDINLCAILKDERIIEGLIVINGIVQLIFTVFLSTIKPIIDKIFNTSILQIDNLIQQDKLLFVFMIFIVTCIVFIVLNSVLKRRLYILEKEI